jgi:hypothetical protein
MYKNAMGVVAAIRHAAGERLGRPRKWRLLQRLPTGAVCAEVGVYKGDNSRHILKYAKPRELHLIDGWWTVEGDTYEHPWYQIVGEQPDTRAAYAQVEALARKHPQCLLHVGDDLEILPTFADRYFDWVYLDSSHEYGHTVKELDLLERKVKTVICGHDWFPDPASEHHGVYRAVSELCSHGNWRVTWTDDWDQWAIERTGVRSVFGD